MSISSSLAAGVSGLNANAQKLASISDNIANSATFGYKRTFTDFHSMVVNSGADSRFTAGGVSSTTSRLIDERGQLQGTDNSTDISINGRGFLPVTQRSEVGGTGQLAVALATTGSFRPDDEGILVDASGKVLLGWPATLDGTFPSFPRDSVDGLEPINVYHNQFSANPTTEMSLALNLPSTDSDPADPGGPHDMTLEYFGNLGQTETLNFQFEPSPAAVQNEWTMTLTDSNSGNMVGQYTLLFSDGNVGGGTLQQVTPITGGAYDDTTGTFDVTVGGGDISIEIGRYGEAGGITQLDSSFAPSELSKNGSSVGNFLGVEIDEGGIMRAVYDSGFTRPIYQVPVIDVPNPNGLNSEEAQTYSLSLESGGMFLWDAGRGPVGETVGFTREASTTDVALELTQLIQTQRAYSSNAKVIQTVDEMLQETTNLKR